MRSARSLQLLFAAIPLGAVLALSAAANANTVGTAGAVNTTSSGTPPGAPTRVIEIGTQVVENEKIQTTSTGSVQVLFIDKTTLNVGPNSTLVIDRFVYNPATTKGELALSLGKGVVRVVGGIATHSEGATIRTPVAAIGLRGGIAIISHSGDKGTQAILGFGRMSVTSLCAASNCTQTTTDVSRPGFAVTVTGLNRLSLFTWPRKQPGDRTVECSIDEPERPKGRRKPGADRQSRSQLQRGHAQLAGRADRRHRLAGSGHRAHNRERHSAERPTRVAEQRVLQNHAKGHHPGCDKSPDAGHAAYHAGHASHASHAQSRQSPQSPQSPQLFRLRQLRLKPTPW